MSLISPQGLFSNALSRCHPIDLAEQRAAALLIAALCAPEKIVKDLAILTDATCPPEQPIAQIILSAADWLVDQTGPYGDLPFAAPFIPNLRGHLAVLGLATNICAALDFAYATTKNRVEPMDDFYSDPNDLRAAIVLNLLY